MKKKLSFLRVYLKLKLRMKLTILILCLCILQVSASITTNGQNFNLQIKDQTLKEVLKEIENKTSYRFFYNDVIMDINKMVTLNLNNKNIQQVMDKLLNGSEVSYKILNNNLVVIAPALELQQTTVKGTITDSNTGETLIGVSVVIEGTSTGAISDAKGEYSIEVSKPDAVLVFSYIGYVTERVQFQGQKTINVKMVPDIKKLEEIVVVGYGTQKKADLSSAITVLKPEQMLKVPGGFNSILQSEAAGVQITGDKIRIRGVGSINNTDPLYVVDGMVGGTVPDETLIESVQILKDAASTAIYGSRGANGVIVVTTKRGAPGTKIEYDGYSGVKTISKKIDMLNGQQLAELINEEMYNANPSRTDYLSALSNPAQIGNGYDMLGAMFHTGKYQKHNLSISGGSDKATFRINTTYSTDDAIQILNKSKNYTLQVLSDFKLGKLKIGETVRLNWYNQDYSEYSIIDAEKWSSTCPVYDKTTSTGYGNAGNGTDVANPLQVANFNSDNNSNIDLSGNWWANYEILPGLKYKFNMGVSLGRGRFQRYVQRYTTAYSSNPSDDLTMESTVNERFLYENTLSYDKEINGHSFSAVVGVTSEKSKYSQIHAAASDFPSPDVPILSTTLDASTKDVNSDIDKWAMYSFLGRLNYSYKSKYMITANFRRDGSSNFGSTHRYGNFPSISGAWRISKENFMRNIDFISDLKLRASYGSIGNQDISHFQYQNTVSFNSWYYLNGTKTIGALPIQPANKDVKWESSYSTDYGLDLRVLKDRLSLTVDYFDKTTKDMLVNVPISYTAGFEDASPVLNAGSINNKGLEVALTYRETVGKLYYSVSENLSTVKNKVESLGAQNEILSGNVSPAGENVTRTAVGGSIGQFWGYVTDGLYKTQAQLDADKAFAPNAGLGDIRFKDFDNSGAIDSKDKRYIGNPIPKFSYGFNFDASYDMGNYGKLDFSMIWQGSYGNDIYNNSKYWGEGMYHYYNDFSSVLNRYRAEDVVISGVTYHKNTDTDIPRAVLGDPNKNLRVSDRFVEDGSYLRLKSLTLGYTFPKSLLGKYKIDRMRVYVGGKNLLTFTKYSGFDPEVASVNYLDNGRYNLNRGIDAVAPWLATYPNSKEVFFGLQFSF
ncbi:MAG: TonB-dependent receptor [Bacteroidota bacterium]|nr:TonB-dependent receptor [Bacteroidota bacterium]